jgi:glutaredoxin
MFRFRFTTPDSVPVTLYSKPGCHLCQDALELLESLGRRYPLQIDEIDIRSDPDLFRRYDIRIPVIAFDDGTEIEAPVDSMELRAALKARSRRR